MSGDIDSIFIFQEIPWIKRRVASIAPIHLRIDQYEKDGVSFINMKQSVAGLIGGDDKRALDSTEYEFVDVFFGSIKSCSSWILETDIEDDFLRDGWLQKDSDMGGLNGKALVHSVIKGRDWVANEILGFSLIGNMRRLTKRIIVARGSERIMVIVAYDFCRR